MAQFRRGAVAHLNEKTYGEQFKPAPSHRIASDKLAE
jgi:hypothetical protein